MRLAPLLLLLCAPFPLSAGFLDPVAPATPAGEPVEVVRAWVRARLSEEVARGSDLNRLVSLAVPLARDYQRSPGPDSLAVLQRTAVYLGRVRIPQTECRKLWQVQDAAAALRAAGVEVDTGPTAEKARRCDRTGSRFDLADALIQECIHGAREHRERLPGALDALAAAQRRDGSFVAEDGRPSFHLTARAVLALDACGGAQERVQGGQRVLAGMLPGLRHRGLNGRMAEALMVLDSTAAQVPERRRHVDYLGQRIRPDGGLCPEERPGCRSDWRVTGFLLDVLSVEAGRSAVDPEGSRRYQP